MVKNLSNPLNARKVAQILSEDISKLGFTVDERDISVFLSDNRINDFKTAFTQLKQQIVPKEYQLTEECLIKLIEHDFIDETFNIIFSEVESEDNADQIFDEINTKSVEFKNQFESLKNKLIKSWSGGISIEGNELEHFDRKFGKPMESFKQQKSDLEMTDLQAFSVIYATDHLGLGDNSKDDIYYLIFGRFDEYKTELSNEFGFKYKWPQITGTSFIDVGKKYSIGPEIAELAKKIRSTSGLDTYPDEVIQYFFHRLIDQKLTTEMIEKKLIYRWSDVEGISNIEDPFTWLLPPLEFNLDQDSLNLILQVVLTHTVLYRIETTPPSLIELLREVKNMENNTRVGYLSKKIETSLTKKSVALQFGTTLANFFENFKTNPSKINPFLTISLRYFKKSENLKPVVTTIEHNIRTAMKNSTGLIKEHLRNVSDEQLKNTIQQNLEISLQHGIEQALPDFSHLIFVDFRIIYDKLDQVLLSIDEFVVEKFFVEVFDQLFNLMNRYTKSLELEKLEPTTTEGGLTELTQDFESTIKYHGAKNWEIKSIASELVEHGITQEIADLICNISSYITYQIASKEGSNGEIMMDSLIKSYERKALQLGSIELLNGLKYNDNEQFRSFILDDLRQAHVLVSLTSKIKTDVYNAWTPLSSGLAKSTKFLNELVIPNLYYWQRIPRKYIEKLLEDNLIDKSKIKDFVVSSNRQNLLEAFSLLILGSKADMNTVEDAREYLEILFMVEGNLEETFKISPRSGEAEIALEAIYLWSHLQEVTQ